MALDLQRRKRGLYTGRSLFLEVGKAQNYFRLFNFLFHFELREKRWKCYWKLLLFDSISFHLDNFSCQDQTPWRRITRWSFVLWPYLKRIFEKIVKWKNLVFQEFNHFNFWLEMTRENFGILAIGRYENKVMNGFWDITDKTQLFINAFLIAD